MPDLDRNKSVRHCHLEALGGVEDFPRVVEGRRSFYQSDRLLDDCDNRLLEGFEEAHAGMIAQQQFPCRRIVALNNAYSQFSCSHRQEWPPKRLLFVRSGYHL